MIKAITKGKMYPVSIGDGTDLKEAGVAFRGISNKLTFMGTQYNASGVTTTTPKADQYIFMDSTFNAQYDVNVLASAFNMDKADFMGRLKLIDDWTTFDNDRFNVIRENSTMIEEVTEEELALMANVKAVLVDAEWFQIYDNNNKFTEKYVASGMYWNYFYNVWKTVSSSPFSNAVVFVTDSATITLPETITVEITDKSINENATVLTLVPQVDGAQLNGGNVEFVQTQTATTNGIAIHKYGVVMIPATAIATELTLELNVNGTKYVAGTTISASNEVEATVEFTKQNQI